MYSICLILLIITANGSETTNPCVGSHRAVLLTQDFFSHCVKNGSLSSKSPEVLVLMQILKFSRRSLNCSSGSLDQEEGAETPISKPTWYHQSTPWITRRFEDLMMWIPKHVQKHHNLALTLMSSHFPLFILGKDQFIMVSQSEQWELIDRRHWVWFLLKQTFYRKVFSWDVSLHP